MMYNEENPESFEQSVIFTISDADIQKVEKFLLGGISLFDDKSLFDSILKQESESVSRNFIQEAIRIPAFLDFINKLSEESKLVADIDKNTQKLIENGLLQLKQLADGNFSATLRNRNKFGKQITLKREYFSPDLLNSLNNVATQIQLREIMEQLVEIQFQINRVITGTTG